jgi:hypothetical protein
MNLAPAHRAASLCGFVLGDDQDHLGEAASMTGESGHKQVKSFVAKHRRRSAPVDL